MVLKHAPPPPSPRGALADCSLWDYFLQEHCNLGLTENGRHCSHGANIKGSGSHLQSQNVRLDKKYLVCRSKYHVGTLLKN